MPVNARECPKIFFIDKILQQNNCQEFARDASVIFYKIYKISLACEQEDLNRNYHEYIFNDII